MNSKNYLVETLTGQPVFTTGRKPTLDRTDRRLCCLEVDGLERHRMLWERRLGQQIRFVPAGTVEFLNVEELGRVIPRRKTLRERKQFP